MYFLSETYHGVECAAYGHAAGAPFRGVVIPEAIQRAMRERATCRYCQQSISPKVQIVVRGGFTYHPSCSRRAASTADKPVAPRVIAQIGGSIPIFDRAGCSVLSPDGRSCEHERFAPDAFDASIAKGGQELQVNHGAGGVLAGHFRTLRNDGGELRFSFALRDGSLERRMLETITRGELRGLSFAFQRQEQRYERPSVVYVRARLKEISLVTTSHRPAWFGSRVWVEATW